MKLEHCTRLCLQWELLNPVSKNDFGILEGVMLVQKPGFPCLSSLVVVQVPTSISFIYRFRRMELEGIYKDQGQLVGHGLVSWSQTPRIF